MITSLIADIDHVNDDLLSKIDLDPNPIVENWEKKDQFQFDAVDFIQQHYIACEEESCVHTLNQKQGRIKDILKIYNGSVYEFITK